MNAIQLTETDEERFSQWMTKKVKSIHYANNEEMLKAYNAVTDNNKRLILAYGTL